MNNDVVYENLKKCNQLLQSSTEYLEYKNTDLIECLAFIKDLLNSDNDNNKYKTTTRDLQQISTLLWNYIQRPDWKTIDNIVRDLYSFISIHYSLNTILNHDSNDDISVSIKDSIQILDYALIVGGPLYRNQIHQLIDILNNSSNSNSNNNNNNNIKTTNYIKTNIKPFKLYQDMVENVDVLDELPSLQQFQGYMNRQQIVIIRNAIQHWPAIKKWCDLNYLKKVAGNRTVPIEIGKHYLEKEWTQKLLPISDFISDYISNDDDDDDDDDDNDHNNNNKGYLAQTLLFDQIKELRNDIIVPDYCCLSTSDDGGDQEYDDDDNVTINAWFGPHHTTTPLHYDGSHNLLCQVVGMKYIRLYNPNQSEYLYPLQDKSMGNSSGVDIESPDFNRYPHFKKANFSECVLKAGDMLYIPPKHWHFVKSLTTSFSVSFWWR
ncbi:hypothetical protein CYY_005716 [Polysphondylium violaceum]|uniref:JmjC domain-containing protein n=1 Tax=Polysphondylium violaceum TaxID=133409 RepID=A0A8J4URZ8_9MYCE|nr:hypothetical protein CYY_005716 [Polysphondylium violaceum]